MYLRRLLIGTLLAISAIAQDDTTPLHLAVREDNVETALKLLAKGANANATTRNGITPLYLAALNRNAEMVSALLKAGADPNRALPGGETILMTASRAGNSELVEILINKGAKVEVKGPSFGETPLMVAASANQPEVIKVLLKHGADVNGRSTELKYDKDRFGLEGVVTILPAGSWTPLMYAAREGSREATRVLADAGAELNVGDPEGSTPLLLAIINGHYDTAAALIEKGANPNTTDSTGMGPLYAAVNMNTLGEIFGRPGRVSPDKLTAFGLTKLLLEKGADPNAALKAPTLQRAHTPGDPALSAGATPLARAAHTGDVASIELLIAHKADVNLALKNGTTPLMFACGLGRGTSAFARDYGTEADLVAATQFLLAHGADINAISTAGQTALHYAATAVDVNLPQPSDDLIKLLASKGAKLDVADKQNRTPIEMAEGKGVRGWAGGPVKPREGTVALLRQLMAAK